MQEPAPKGIVQPTKQHDQDLHQNVGKSLEQLGQQASTVPHHEKPVLGKAVSRWIAEKGNDAAHIADVTVNPDDAKKIRLVQNNKTPFAIVMEKLKLRREAA